MAGYAMQHAEVVARNITAHLNGERPTATYLPLPLPLPVILLPLGPRGGVGQLPTPDGPAVVTAETVSQYKGAGLFTGAVLEHGASGFTLFAADHSAPSRHAVVTMAAMRLAVPLRRRIDKRPGLGLIGSSLSGRPPSSRMRTLLLVDVLVGELGTRIRVRSDPMPVRWSRMQGRRRSCVSGFRVDRWARMLVEVSGPPVLVRGWANAAYWGHALVGRLWSGQRPGAVRRGPGDRPVTAVVCSRHAGGG